MSFTPRLEDFDYRLPPDRIAQEPLARRDASRLMVLDRSTGGTSHKTFTDLPGLLSPGDLLVVNDTRVLAARLAGRRSAPGTGGRIEALLLQHLGENRWKALAKGPTRPGETVDFGAGLTGRVESRDEAGSVVIALSAADGVGPVEEALERSALMPTPPYVKRSPGDPRQALDRERYQTVFASRPGALAAPTAGLHFTPDLMGALRTRGIETTRLTLHVGLGTFQPVRVRDVREHRMHQEWCAVTDEVRDAVARTRRRGGRVVAIGTTVTRALESRANEQGDIRTGEAWCDLFILPGYRFRVVDALVTNFHLPRSTLLMLVSAFGGSKAVLSAYAEAIREGYRFYSYGDAMLITGAPPAAASPRSHDVP